MFVYTTHMLSDLPRILRQRNPPDTTRHGLVAEIELVSAAQSALDAYRHRITAAIDDLGDKGLDAAGVLRSVGRMSSRAAGRVAKTAAPMAELPHTVEALAAGAITAEHADVLADASKRVDSGLVDTDLVKIACSSPADLFARRAREWVSRRQDAGDAAERRHRQRGDRTVTSWSDGDGMKVWLAKLDPVTAASVSSSLDAEYDRLWRLDGGRDTANGADAGTRTAPQRMADAFVSLVTGSAVTGTGSSKVHIRQQMLSVVDLSRMRINNPEGSATLVDGTSLPQSALEQLACVSDITGVIFDGPGNPIWVGRTSRHATTTQWKALLARDRGCIGCGADPNRCEAHHVLAWNRGGSTDITNLVLVCSRCHHNIHDRGMKLARGPDGWEISSRAGPSSREIAAGSTLAERSAWSKPTA